MACLWSRKWLQIPLFPSFKGLPLHDRWYPRKQFSDNRRKSSILALANHDVLFLCIFFHFHSKREKLAIFARPALSTLTLFFLSPYLSLIFPFSFFPSLPFFPLSFGSLPGKPTHLHAYTPIGQAQPGYWSCFTRHSKHAKLPFDRQSPTCAIKGAQLPAVKWLRSSSQKSKPW